MRPGATDMKPGNTRPTNIVPDGLRGSRLCPEHGRIAGEDGKCVICRDKLLQERGRRLRPRQRRGGTQVGATLVVLAVLAGGGYLFRDALFGAAPPALEDAQGKGKGKARTAKKEGWWQRLTGLFSSEAPVEEAKEEAVRVITVRGKKVTVKAGEVEGPKVVVERKYGGEIHHMEDGRILLKLHGKGGEEMPPDAPAPAGSLVVREGADTGGAPARVTGGEEAIRLEPVKVRGEPRAAAGSPEVLMYATSWCPACSKARAYLVLNKIPYTEKDVQKDPAAMAELKRISPGGGVPTFKINGKVLVGFSPNSLQKALAVAR